MSKPTPGPWTFTQQDDLDSEGNGYTWAIQASREPDYNQNPAYANNEANARLIAAAPALLEALLAVQDELRQSAKEANGKGDGGAYIYGRTCEEVEAALALVPGMTTKGRTQ